jgi:hypothetical protein
MAQLVSKNPHEYWTSGQGPGKKSEKWGVFGFLMVVFQQ